MKRLFSAILLPFLLAACDRRVVEVNPDGGDSRSNATGVYALTVNDLGGDPVPLDRYQGQVTLLVNVASQCGYTPQYEKLQQLHEAWHDQGFSVVAFPCNDFGGQEPGSPEDIRQVCRVKYETTFPVMAKIQVKSGEAQSPVYAELEQSSGVLPRWNFGKYLVDQDGRTLAFFGSSVDPTSLKLQEAIKQALAQPG